MLLLASQSWAGADAAVERTVWGTVTQVEPIINNIAITPATDCAGPKPDGAGLKDLLQWDLQPACRIRRQQQVRGYQVSYTWDGRSYTVEMSENPGSRIPLRLRIH